MKVKIDDNKAIVHSDSIKMAASDFLFCKTTNSNEIFKYDICDLATKSNIYEFSSPIDITITDGISTNNQLCAAIAAAAQGAGGVATVAAIGSAAAAAPAAVTTASAVGTVAAAGATSAATVGSFAAGAQVAGAVILAAAGPLAIIAGAGALIGAA